MGRGDRIVNALLILGMVGCLIGLVMFLVGGRTLLLARFDEQIQDCLQRTVINQEVECHWQFTTQAQLELLKERFTSQLNRCYYYQQFRPEVTWVLRVC